MAAGPLANASFPDIRGIEAYAGHKIHSARWDHDYDMTGKRVAVIGFGNTTPSSTYATRRCLQTACSYSGAASSSGIGRAV